MIAPDLLPTPEGDLVIQPIDHASLVLTLGRRVFYVDPVGGAARYHGLAAPTGILVTHEHGDHLDTATLEAISAATQPPILASAGAAAKLPDHLKRRTTILLNGQGAQLDGVRVEAIPAHNTTPDRLRYHPPGLCNGYVFALGGKRIYIAGDTEPHPAMLELEDIDIAFLPMNLPYTMVAEQAAAAVRAFRPRLVYPFHYTEGPEPTRFLEMLQGEAGIEVRLRDWYAVSREAA